jgi:hypothetical protein
MKTYNKFDQALQKKSDLSIDLAKECVTDEWIPSVCPLTSDFSADDRAAMMLQFYGLSVTTVHLQFRSG